MKLVPIKGLNKKPFKIFTKRKTFQAMSRWINIELAA